MSNFKPNYFQRRSKPRGPKANERIRALDVQVIGSDGGNLGAMPLNKAIEIVVVSKQASISLLQRRLSIGYSRAARLIDEMERLGIVGPFSGSKAREILVDESYLETIKDDDEEI